MISKLSFFIFGFIFFSEFISVLQLKLLRLPFFIFEPIAFGVLILLLWRRRVSFLSAISPLEFLFVYLFLSFLSALILLAVAGPSNSGIVDAVSSARPFVFALVGAICYRLTAKESLASFSLFFFGIVLGDFFTSFITPFVSEDFRGITKMNVVAVFSLSFILVRFQHPLFIFAGLFALLIIAFNSGFRINVLAILVGMSTGLLSRALYNKSVKSIAKILAILTVAIVIVRVSFNLFLEYGRNFVDPFVYFRIANRLSAYFEGDIQAAQDDNRLNVVLGHLSDSFSFFPIGFTMIADEKVGMFNDFPVLYFWDNFGLALGALMLFSLIGLGFLHFLSVWIKNKSSVSENLSAWFFFFFFALLLLNGRFLYISQEAFLFGFLIGPWLFSNGVKRLARLKEGRSWFFEGGWQQTSPSHPVRL